MQAVGDAQQHCIFMTARQRLDEKAAGFRLKPNHRFRFSVSGEAFLSSHVRSKTDPSPGLTVIYCTDEQAG